MSSKSMEMGSAWYGRRTSRAAGEAGAAPVAYTEVRPENVTRPAELAESGAVGALAAAEQVEVDFAIAEAETSQFVPRAK